MLALVCRKRGVIAVKCWFIGLAKGLKRYLNLATRQKYTLSDFRPQVYNYTTNVKGKFSVRPQVGLLFFHLRVLEHVEMAELTACYLISNQI